MLMRGIAEPHALLYVLYLDLIRSDHLSEVDVLTVNRYAFTAWSISHLLLP